MTDQPNYIYSLRLCLDPDCDGLIHVRDGDELATLPCPVCEKAIPPPAIFALAESLRWLSGADKE